jgi:hypothetical protein
MKGDKSVDGITSYLTKQHSGIVREKGIVKMTSKSVADNHPGHAERSRPCLSFIFHVKELARPVGLLGFWSTAPRPQSPHNSGLSPAALAR